MKLNLVPDWRAVLWRSWSNRLTALTLLLYVAEQSLPLWQFLPHETRQFLPSWFFGVLPAISLGLTVLARVLKQRKLDEQRNSAA